ncbi:MAG: esterase [Candidatus Eremiobacteraeota bacterium]|nr:esterase [Candidatus Eremiobacteraeota bacterium]MCW5865982.1 esterase [Candidatus Eremiobacteraeota bacterium]
MHREYFAWHSPHLKKKAEILVFGHSGQNWLVFPTAKGRFFDWENFGMIEALRQPLERGWLRLTCVDSFDRSAFYARTKPWFRIWKHTHYDQYVRHEVIPFARQQLGSPFLATAGCSFGAYHAVNFALRYPDLIHKTVAMSGVYDLAFRLGRYKNTASYFHSPLHYLPGLRHPALQKMRVHLGVGTREPFAHQHLQLAQMLDARGATVSLDINPHGDHSWDYWGHYARRAV